MIIEGDILLYSFEWCQLLDSISSAFRINIIFHLYDGSEYSTACGSCRLCRTCLQNRNCEKNGHIKCCGGESPDTAPEVFDKEEFSIKNDAYISAYRNKQCRMGNIVPLHESIKDVKCLMSDAYEILSDKARNMNEESISLLLSTVRLSDIVVLSTFMGEGNALEYSIKTILCISNLIFQARGSWCEYIDGKDSMFIKSGDCRFRKEIWSRSDRNFVSAAIIDEDIQGILCIEAPVRFKQAEALSGLFVKELLLILELNDMLKTMKSAFGLISTLGGTAVMLVGRSKQICYANRTAWDMLGLNDADFQKNVEPNILTPWCNYIADNVAEPVRGVKEDYYGRSINWGVFPLMRKGVPHGWVVMLVDDSERQKLREISSETELMAANQMMMSSITHEIKNPLSSIRGLLQMIISDKESGELCEYLKLGIREIDRANRLVDDLFQIKKTTAKSSEIIDLNNYLESIIPTLNGLVANKSVRIDVEQCQAVTIHTDLEQFDQVIINIVKNAVEAIENEGSIHISIREASSHWVEVLIRDSGRGIPPHMKKRLFEPFITTKGAGTGLGLNICKAIIHNNGGEVSAQNHPEGGALFSIILPSGAYNCNDANRQDVLVLTCDDFIRKLVNQSLLLIGFKVTTVSTFDNALFLLKRYDFALTVFDESILNMSDYYSLREAYPEISTIILSNDKSAGECKNAQYISKTLVGSVFAEAVRQKISESMEKYDK